jgi:hypothetical protein
VKKLGNLAPSGAKSPIMEKQETPLRNGWPIILSEEQKIRAELKILEAGYKEAASSPEKALAFLQRAGILDEKGELSEHYR